MPLRDGETRQGQFCQISQFGLWPRYVQAIMAVRKDGNVVYSRSLSFETDHDGRPIQALSMTNVMLLFAPVVFAWLLLRFKQTPGKMVTGLRVRRRDSAALSFSKALTRETLKLLPVLIVALAGIHMELTFDLDAAARQVASLSADAFFDWKNFVLPIVVTVLAVILYIVPFLRWRGHTLYDRWLGLAVDHVEAP